MNRGFFSVLSHLSQDHFSISFHLYHSFWRAPGHRILFPLYLIHPRLYITTRPLCFFYTSSSLFPLDHVCGFEDVRICGFSQDRSDVFDWTRQNHLSQNPKRSVNTGPDTDRSGTKEGKHSCIRILYSNKCHIHTRVDISAQSEVLIPEFRTFGFRVCQKRRCISYTCAIFIPWHRLKWGVMLSPAILFDCGWEGWYPLSPAVNHSGISQSWA